MSDISPVPQTNPMGDINSILSMLSNIFGLQSDSTQTITENSPDATSALSQIFPLLMQQFSAGDYSAESAVRDAQPQVDQIVRQLAEFGIPNTFQAEGASGGYNSTTGQLLRNDLTSRAATEAASKISAVKTQYAGARNQQALILAQIANIMANANHTRTTQTSATNNAQTTQGRNAAAGLALASLLRGLLGNKGNANPSSSRSGQSPGGGPNPRSGIETPDDRIGNMQDVNGLGTPENIDDRIGDFTQVEGLGGPTPVVSVNNTDNFNDILGQLGGINPENPNVDFGDPYSGLNLGGLLPEGGNPDPEVDPFQGIDLGAIGGGTGGVGDDPFNFLPDDFDPGNGGGDWGP